MRIIITLVGFFCMLPYISEAQLKWLVDDFESFATNQNDFKKDGFFTYGSARITSVDDFTTGNGYSGKRGLKVNWESQQQYGGWGKGIGMHIVLNAAEDYLNFYTYIPSSNGRTDKIKIAIEEDDNNSSVFEKEHDDSWSTQLNLQPKDQWELVSIPLNAFKDETQGGDGKFNISYKDGKLLTLIISYPEPAQIQDHAWYFDFICFSKGKLPTGTSVTAPPPLQEEDYCLLGAWSEEGNNANFISIPESFESNFKQHGENKLGLVHFFMPFSIEKDQKKELLYPSVEKINQIIDKGYIPMITIENHFVKIDKKKVQPNLYSITEGHFDYFFTDWAKKIKKVKGEVLVRILHEFNGNWYPWCIALNDKNPELYVKAYRHIWSIFKNEQATNVKFVWCPNSMSVPQESWNYIMDAYPGDQYVDYTGLDVYNGAGEKGIPLWRSFRKEGIENYFILTQLVPEKPLLICETSSRERMAAEHGKFQGKDEWIAQMSEALKTDMSKIRLLSWFNEYPNFKITSSAAARTAYAKYIWQDNYFRSKKENFLNLKITKQ